MEQFLGYKEAEARELLASIPAGERQALEDIGRSICSGAVEWLMQDRKRVEVRRGHVISIHGDTSYSTFDPEAAIGWKENGQPDYSDQYFARSARPLDSLPPSIGNLSRLKSMNFRWNHLASLPQEIVNLEKMTGLDLHHNKFEELGKPLTSLSNLEKLRLDYTLVERIDDSLGNMTCLEELWLGFWPTYDGPCRKEPLKVPGSIGKLVKLKKLVLTWIPLVSLPPTIVNLRKLGLLDIEGSRVVEGRERLGLFPEECRVKTGAF